MTNNLKAQARRAAHYAEDLIRGLGPNYEPIPIRIISRNHTLAELNKQRALAARRYDKVNPFYNE